MTTESDVTVSIPEADKRELTIDGRRAIETKSASLPVSTWDIISQKFNDHGDKVDIAKTADDVAKGMTVASMVSAGVGVGLVCTGFGSGAGAVMIAGAVSTTTGVIAFAANWKKSASLKYSEETPGHVVAKWSVYGVSKTMQHIPIPAVHIIGHVLEHSAETVEVVY